MVHHQLYFKFEFTVKFTNTAYSNNNQFQTVTNYDHFGYRDTQMTRFPS